VTVALLLLSFVVFIALGLPVAFALGLASAVGMIAGNVPFALAPQRMFVLTNSFTLMAIPFFMFAGEVMNTGGITRRIIDLSDALIGHIRGGLANVNILASMFFSGINGSSAADTSAIGAVLIPAMVEKGYDKHFSVAVTCASSCIGPIIPPSIMMIIYGSLTGQSIAALFMAGVIPGILLGLAMMGITYAHALQGRYMAPPRQRATLPELGAAFRRALLPLLMPVIILGGIVFGVVTATEAGVLAAVLGLVLGGLVYRELTLERLRRVFVVTTIRTAQVMLIAAFAAIFAWLLAKDQFGVTAAALISQVTDNTTIVLLLIALIALITGAFVDTIGTSLILIPILHPLAVLLGIEPLHVATVLVLAIVLGGITPPVAPLLYVASSIGEADVIRSMRATLPLFFAAIGVVVLVACFPPLATFLPRLVLAR
jgi:tripartite ATP-independent transporter DctM subunit